jgi:hypothetical protein
MTESSNWLIGMLIGLIMGMALGAVLVTVFKPLLGTTLQTYTYDAAGRVTQIMERQQK